NAACTVIELTGLLIVIAAGIPYLGSVNIFALESIPQTGTLTPGLVLSGAVLAFYSFVGFEDVINVGEEVIDPKRTLPLGLLLAMLIASAVYMLIGVVAVSVVPPDQLAHSNQPLVDVVKKAWPWFPTQIFSVIALFAVANTALLNFIMSSRLLYGLANLGLLPKALAKVHAKTKTPYVAVIAVLAILLTLAYLGEVASLARATSLFVLLVFMAMNASLFLFQWRERHHKRSRRWRIPQIVPILGTLGAGTMLFFAEAKDYQIAGIMLAIIIGLYFIERPDPSQIEKFES
ncbi:MAG TPA: APC family permease, partial [Bdellovibrionales bacterium]|nr:APC family permease [Bdellovibrionales bacterium]